MKKKICLAIFIVLFVVSILVNVKLLFFSPAVSLKNIPFEGVITEADSGKIVVKGDGTNGCGLTEHYQTRAIWTKLLRRGHGNIIKIPDFEQKEQKNYLTAKKNGTIIQRIRKK